MHIAQQQLREGACPSSAWVLGRGIAYPNNLSQITGLNLKQSVALQQLRELEAGAEEGEARAAAAAGDADAGAAAAAAADGDGDGGSFTDTEVTDAGPA